MRKPYSNSQYRLNAIRSVFIVLLVAIGSSGATAWGQDAKSKPAADKKTATEKKKNDDEKEKKEPVDDELIFDFHAARYERWRPTVDALFLQRNRADRITLINRPSDRREILNAADFGFQHEAGIQVGLSRRWCSGYGVEMSFFAVDWDESVNISGDLGFPGPGFTFNVNPASFDTRIASTLYSSEVNFVKHGGGLIDFHLGTRWLRYDDNLRIRENNVPISQVFDVDTDNNLWGVQAGARFQLLELGPHFLAGGNGGVEVGPYLSIDSRVNFGVLYNSARQSSRSSIVGPALTATSDEVAYLGEFSLNANYRLSEHFSLRLGYRWIWLSGMAGAPDQIHFNNMATSSAGIDARDSISFNGAHLGAEFIW